MRCLVPPLFLEFSLAFAWPKRAGRARSRGALAGWMAGLCARVPWEGPVGMMEEMGYGIWDEGNNLIDQRGECLWGCLGNMELRRPEIHWILSVSSTI